MPTRILSWQQLVLENDPDWIRGSLNPIVWEFSNGRRFMDRTQVYFPLPDIGLTNDGGVLIVTDSSGWPTSPIGLVTNEVWDNGGVVTVVSGALQPGANPMFFGQITASQLLLFGGNGLPSSAPQSGSGQLWNNGNVVGVA